MQTITYNSALGATTVLVVNVPNPIVGALGYRVYRTTGAAAIGTAVLVGTMLETDTQFIDYNDGNYVATVPPVTSTIPVQKQFTVNIYDTRVSRTTPQESFECSLESRTNSAGAQTVIDRVINSGGGSSLVRVLNNVPSCQSFQQ